MLQNNGWGEGTVSTALNEHLLSILELSKLISICIMELAAEYFWS